jgi:hypothetical protein
VLGSNFEEVEARLPAVFSFVVEPEGLDCELEGLEESAMLSFFLRIDISKNSL